MGDNKTNDEAVSPLPSECTGIVFMEQLCESKAGGSDKDERKCGSVDKFEGGVTFHGGGSPCADAVGVCKIVGMCDGVNNSEGTRVSGGICVGEDLCVGGGVCVGDGFSLGAGGAPSYSSYNQEAPQWTEERVKEFTSRTGIGLLC